MQIVGLGGKAGSGKSTAAAYLRDLGYEEIAFADPLKVGAETLFGFNPEQTYGALKEQIDPRLGKSPREVLQRLGDACREIWPDIFVSAIRRKLFGLERLVVVSDVRRLNEARSLKLLGAVLICIERPGAGAVNGVSGHISESELDYWPGWDVRIKNEDSLDDLYHKIGYVLQRNHLPPFDGLS